MDFRNYTDYYSFGSRFFSKTTDDWLGKTRHDFPSVECTVRSIKHLLPIDNICVIFAPLGISYHRVIVGVQSYHSHLDLEIASFPQHLT